MLSEGLLVVAVVLEVLEPPMAVPRLIEEEGDMVLMMHPFSAGARGAVQ
jgi:hypothetical protein